MTSKAKTLVPKRGATDQTAMHEAACRVYGADVCCAPILGPGPSTVPLNANSKGLWSKPVDISGKLPVGSKITQ